MVRCLPRRNLNKEGRQSPARSCYLATNLAKLTENLCRFYDFNGKVVLLVGAGGRQLLDPGIQTQKLVAIDREGEALRELGARVAAKGWQNRVDVIAADFHQVAVHGDTVYFEFCLHEINDPEKALVHAKSLASDIVVYDHSAGSEWAYYAAEEEKVARSSAAVGRFGIRRRQLFRAEQRFAHYAELLAKLRPQGPVAIRRAQRFAEATDIVIPMGYELNLL